MMGYSAPYAALLVGSLGRARSRPLRKNDTALRYPVDNILDALEGWQRGTCCDWRRPVPVRASSVGVIDNYRPWTDFESSVIESGPDTTVSSRCSCRDARQIKSLGNGNADHPPNMCKVALLGTRAW